MVPMDDLAVARATMLLLSAPLTRRPGESYSTIWLNGLEVSREKAVEELAATRKPVECSSELAHGKLLISCKRVDHRSDQRPLVEWADSIADGIVAMMAMLGGDKVLPMLLRSQFESLMLEASCVRTWLKDYRLSGFSLSLILEDQAAKAQGALGALVVGKPVTVIPSRE
jgi:hypothetical protein